MLILRKILCGLFALGVLCAAGMLAAQGTQEAAKAGGDEAMSRDGIQVAAYYFPNWHRKSWDKGDVFGEWVQIRRAKPRFPGHAQPKAPLWGYQDEADPQAMAQKIEAAASHGIQAFLFDCYYSEQGTYLEDALSKGFLHAANNRRIAFALMWANHDIGAKIKGAISREGFDRLTDHVIKDYFPHPSYWKVDGKCYFSIYQVQTFVNGLGGVANAKKSLDDFERKARVAGLKGIHVNVVDHQIKNLQDASTLLRELGVDSVTSYVWVHLVRLKDFPQTDYDLVRQQYFSTWDQKKDAYGVPYYPNVTMGWDPTPRIPPDQPHDGRGYPNTAVLKNNTPDRFRAALEDAKARLLARPRDQRILTINAWNEWGEGSYLEPDTVTQMGYLQAIREVFPPKER